MSNTPRTAISSSDNSSDLKRLDSIISRAELRGFHSLSTEDVEDFPRLYRQALTLQEHARENRLDRALIDRLSNLTARGAILLRKPSEPLLSWLLRALGLDLPRALWRERWFVAAGFASSVLGLFFGWWALSLNPELRDVLIPEKISSLAVRHTNPLEALMELWNNIERLLGGNIDNRQIQIFVTTIKSMAIVVSAGILLGFPSLALGFIFSAMAGAMAAYEVSTRSVIFGADHLIGCVGLLVLVSAFTSTAGLIIGSGLWRNGANGQTTVSQRFPVAIVFLGWGFASSLLLLWALVQSFPMVPKVVHPNLLLGLPVLVFALVLGWGGISARWGIWRHR